MVFKSEDGHGLHTAHRLSYEAHIGPIGGKFVLHRCDNPACFNPAHLFLGSQRDNMRDMREKGRANVAYGEAHPKVRLSTQEVLSILEDRRLHREIAQSYGIALSTVGNIKSGRSWKRFPRQLGGNLLGSRPVVDGEQKA